MIAHLSDQPGDHDQSATNQTELIQPIHPIGWTEFR